MIKNLPLLIILLFSIVSQAQITKISGTIRDKETKETIPFVILSFKGTHIGTTSNADGFFYLETSVKVDTLEVICIGYQSLSVKTEAFKNNELNLELSPSSVDIEEVTIVAGKNPAILLMKKVIKRRKQNNPERLLAYSYEQYNKLQLDINNFKYNPDFAKNKKTLKYKSILDNIGTDTITGKTYLPVLISETLSDYYYQKRPRKEKEIIKAVKISGIENTSLMQFTGQMYLDINLYKNYIKIFEKQFVSPIAVNSLLVYDYYLTDSTFINKKKYYKLIFKPKRKQEYTFDGYMWIADNFFAVKEIKANLSRSVNLEFIKSINFSQKYEVINDSIFFPANETTLIDFNLTDFTPGYFGKKITSRKKIKINPEYEDKFFSKTIPQELITLENAGQADSTYWKSVRHEKLSDQEQQIYKTVDFVKNIPAFKTVANTIKMLSFGYYEIGKFEYGPYFKTYSRNEIEGHRFRIGGRTSSAFSKKTEYSGHIAYGTLDKKFKYGIGFKYRISKNPWVVLSSSYNSDMVQLGASPNAFTEDNIISTVISKEANKDLLLQDKFKIGIEKEWFKGLISEVKFSYKNLYPSEFIKFTDYNDNAVTSLRTSEIILNTHLAYNEKYLESDLSRIFLGSKYPVFDISYSFAPEGLFKNSYNYHKITVNVEQSIFLGFIGKFNYSVEAGKIYGTVPFPLLKLHEGNQTYIFDPYSFNLMNYYEFASDKWLSVYAEHHFQGLFLNKIPLVRKLKMREVLYGKGVIGSLSDENKNEFNFPTTLSDLSTPYIEAGIGIENIFTFFRVDAIWRLTHNDKPDNSKFGIRASFQAQF